MSGYLSNHQKVEAKAKAARASGSGSGSGSGVVGIGGSGSGNGNGNAASAAPLLGRSSSSSNNRRARVIGAPRAGGPLGALGAQASLQRASALANGRGNGGGGSPPSAPSAAAGGGAALRRQAQQQQVQQQQQQARGSGHRTGASSSAAAMANAPPATAANAAAASLAAPSTTAAPTAAADAPPPVPTAQPLAAAPGDLNDQPMDEAEEEEEQHARAHPHKKTRVSGRRAGASSSAATAANAAAALLAGPSTAADAASAPPPVPAAQPLAATPGDLDDLPMAEAEEEQQGKKQQQQPQARSGSDNDGRRAAVSGARVASPSAAPALVSLPSAAAAPTPPATVSGDGGNKHDEEGKSSGSGNASGPAAGAGGGASGSNDDNAEERLRPLAFLLLAMRWIFPWYFGSDLAVAKAAIYLGAHALDPAAAFASRADRGALLRMALMFATVVVMNKMTGYEAVERAPFFSLRPSSVPMAQLLSHFATERAARVLYASMLKGAHGVGRGLAPIVGAEAELNDEGPTCVNPYPGHGTGSVAQRVERSLLHFTTGFGGLHTSTAPSVAITGKAGVRAAGQDDLLISVTSTTMLKFGNNQYQDQMRSHRGADVFAMVGRAAAGGGRELLVGLIPACAYPTLGAEATLSLDKLVRRHPQSVHWADEPDVYASVAQHLQGLRFSQGAGKVLADVAQLGMETIKMVGAWRVAEAGAPLFSAGYSAGQKTKESWTRTMATASGGNNELVMEEFARFDDIGLREGSEGTRHALLNFAVRCRKNLKGREGVELSGGRFAAQTSEEELKKREEVVKKRKEVVKKTLGEASKDLGQGKRARKPVDRYDA